MVTLKTISEKLRNLDFSNKERVIEIRNLIKETDIEESKPENEIERAILIAKAAYKEKKSSKILNRLKENSEISKLLLIFVGDKSITDWPYLNINYISEENAIEVLDLLGRVFFIDEKMFDFIVSFFNSRRRETWIPAARALASLATRDSEIKKFLIELWNKSFPKGLSEEWFYGAITKGKDSEIRNRQIHTARHVFYCVSYHIYLTEKTEDFPGFSLDKISVIGFPADESDSSILIRSFVNLWKTEKYKKTVEEIIKKNLKRLKKSLLIEEALREFLNSEDPKLTPDVEFTELIIDYLLETDFLKDNTYSLIDLLSSCIETLLLLKKINYPYLEKRLNAFPSDLKELSKFAIYDRHQLNKNSAIELFLNKLTQIINEHIWNINSVNENCFNIIYLLLLYELKIISELPFRNLLGLLNNTGSFIEEYKYEGSLEKNLLPFMITYLSNKNITPRIFFLKKNYEEDTILKLSVIKNGYISIQIAVQLERILRTKKDSYEQIKFLWKFLINDPDSKVFSELYKILRGTNTPLHRIIEALYELDIIRDKKSTSIEDLLKNYLELFKAIIDHLKTDKEKIDKKLYDIEIMIKKLNDIYELVTLNTFISSDPFLLDFEKLKIIQQLMEKLVGKNNDGFIIMWLNWLERNDPTNSEIILKFKIEFEEIVKSGKNPTKNQIDHLSLMLEKVERISNSFTWPEKNLLWLVLNIIKRWIAAIKEQFILAEEINSEIQDSIQNHRDLIKIKKIVNHYINDNSSKEEIKILYPETLRMINSFLQNNLEFELSERLRKNKIVKDLVKLDSFLKYISPMLIGILAGPLLVLDIGNTWSELVADGKSFYYNITLFLAISISLGLFYFNFLTTGVKSADKITLFIKASIFYLLTFILEIFVSSLVIITLAGTSFSSFFTGYHQILKLIILWTALSLLLGWFIGMILQGRKILNE